MFKGIFGRRRDHKRGPYDTPGIGDGLPGSGVGLPDVEAMQEQPKAGFLDQGGIGRGIAGTIGDALLQQNGSAPVYAPAMQQARQMQFARDRYEQRRADDKNDWIAQEQWKRDNPTPANNDSVNDWEFYQKNLSPAQFEEWKLNNIINPTFFTGNDGRRYANPSANRPAVGSVIKDPRKATIENTSAPSLGSNGMPTSLTRQQYMATVNAMGKEKTDAWIARNNVRVGQ